MAAADCQVPHCLLHLEEVGRYGLVQQLGLGVPYQPKQIITDQSTGGTRKKASL